MEKNVLLLESVTDEAHQLLAKYTNLFIASSPTTGGEIAAKHPIHGIITRGKGAVNATLIEQCEGLEVIARCGVGLDNVDVKFATEQGVKVVNAPGINASTVAEHALALMLMLKRQLYTSIKEVKVGNWAYRKNYQGDEIRGKKLGVLGLGNIGQRVAKLATAFGMEIVYWDIDGKAVPYPKLTFDEVLQQADIVSLHLPLFPETRHIIDQGAFEQMKSSALLINTARGAIIDEKALVTALQQQQIAGFASDVLETEPPVSNHPLLQLPNVLITPHSASLTQLTYNEMCVVTVQNAIDVLKGKEIDARYVFNR